MKNYFATENITDGLTREQIFKSALEMTEHGLALQELSNGGVGGVGPYADITERFADIKCADITQAKKWCEVLRKKQNLTLVQDRFCTFTSRSESTTVVVNTEILVINNLTKTVQIANTTTIQREINAFLTSFKSTGLLFERCSPAVAKPKALSPKPQTH